MPAADFLHITEDKHQQALYRLAAVGQYLYDTMAGDEDSDRPEPLPMMAMECVREAQRQIDLAIKHGQRTRRRCLGGDLRLIVRRAPALTHTIGSYVNQSCPPTKAQPRASENSMNQPTRKFLAANGRIASKPQRNLPPGAPGLEPPPELIAEAERVAACTNICDEPEAISKAIVDAHGELAKTFDRLRYLQDMRQSQQDRRLLSMEARMADVHRRAKMRHVNFSGELHKARVMLDRARIGGRREPQAAVRLVESLEYRLDYRPDLEEAA